jgi:hypothetical protein
VTAPCDFSPGGSPGLLHHWGADPHNSRTRVHLLLATTFFSEVGSYLKSSSLHASTCEWVGLSTGPPPEDSVWRGPTTHSQWLSFVAWACEPTREWDPRVERSMDLPIKFVSVVDIYSGPRLYRVAL